MIPNVIDISHHNTINDFSALKEAGIVGVIHKCTQGSNYADPMYESRRKLATDAGLLWGAYTFNTGDNVIAQINEFLDHADADNQTLMALDFEANPTSQMSLAQASTFLHEADIRLGRKLVLYSGNRVKDILGHNVDSFLGSHRLWLPQYGPVAVTQRSWVKPWLWQFSETGKLPGTDGMIDFNFYNGTTQQLTSEWAS